MKALYRMGRGCEWQQVYFNKGTQCDTGWLGYSYLQRVCEGYLLRDEFARLG